MKPWISRRRSSCGSCGRSTPCAGPRGTSRAIEGRMTGLTCTAVRLRLAAFHDDELSLHDRIAVQTHVNECDSCMAELQERYQAVGTALRLAAAPGPADDWTGL